jgi:Polyketide cyclase / dehydrase and lipid transport
MSGILLRQKSGGFELVRLPNQALRTIRSIVVARSYYSTIFDRSADEVWNIIRDFNNYPVWVDGTAESQIEGGRSGDSVGAVRDVLYKGSRRRQKLLALSDVHRSQTYSFVSEPPAHARNFQATLRVTQVIDGNRAFVEWWATFDCDFDHCEERIAFFRNAFAGWLESLRRYLNSSCEVALRSSLSGPAHTV